MRQNFQPRRKLLQALPAVLLAAAALLGLTAAPANAAYAEQPINMIVAYAPGGGTDIIARVLARYIEKYLGNDAKVVVLNRPGAGGAIGFGALASAPPDGTGLGQMSVARTTLAPNLPTFKDQGYDIVLASLRGVAAPKGLPPARYEAELQNAEVQFRQLWKEMPRRDK